jgi:hypothetical protein
MTDDELSKLKIPPDGPGYTFKKQLHPGLSYRSIPKPNQWIPEKSIPKITKTLLDINKFHEVDSFETHSFKKNEPKPTTGHAPHSIKYMYGPTHPKKSDPQKDMSFANLHKPAPKAPIEQSLDSEPVDASKKSQLTECEIDAIIEDGWKLVRSDYHK